MKKHFSMVVVFMMLLALVSTSAFSKIQVGEEVAELVETEHPYAAKKGLVFERTFHSEDAGYIAIHFSHFDVAKGDYVEIVSADGRFRYVYEGEGKKVKVMGKDGKREDARISNFWATHIPGDTAIVRLHSKSNRRNFGFTIDKWVRGYEAGYISAIMDADFDAQVQAICGSNDLDWAKCHTGTEMYNKSRAVCRLLMNGSSACTGWLLGSQGHIMTNNHCISTQATANNTDYEFMAEGATCGTSCASWGACPGTVEASSGTLVKTNAPMDYSLILLPTNVTGTYGYLQLRNTLPTIGERIYIPQHPNHYGKQIAVNSDTDGPLAKIYSTTRPACQSGGPLDIGYYADTNGGSSGSPVIAYEDNFVVALHHCANCPNRGVPIPNIITDLGASLPSNAIGTSTPAPPVADFAADNTTVTLGNAVNFTDLSTKDPTSWSWTFSGGTPGSSTTQNPTNIVYNSLGSYTVSLTATNALGSDDEVKTAYITVVDAPTGYCASSCSNQNYEWVARVQVADIDNSSGGTNYSDFTSIEGNMTRGNNVNLTLTPGFASSTYTENWKIWIDYNRDGDFADAGEEVYSGSGTAAVSGSFTVPAGASTGTTRMRVSMVWNSTPTPCGSWTYGEVEDYHVNIQ